MNMKYFKLTQIIALIGVVRLEGFPPLDLGRYDSIDKAIKGFNDWAERRGFEVLRTRVNKDIFDAQVSSFDGVIYDVYSMNLGTEYILDPASVHKMTAPVEEL